MTVGMSAECRKLPTLSRTEVEHELHLSASAVARHLEVDRVALAYPYGWYSECILEQARDVGLLCGLTTDDGFNDLGSDLFQLKRTLIGDGDTLPTFAARVSGLTALLRGPTRLFRRSSGRPGLIATNRLAHRSGAGSAS